MTLDENINKLRESLTVTSAQALRHEAMLKDHAEWLQAHDKAVISHGEWLKAQEAAAARHDKEMAEARERGKATDERIDRMQAEMRERGRIIDERIEKLVSAIGKMIGERN
jgi:hypothetical protein